MVFRTAAGIATLLIGLNSQAVAQYYLSPQAYPGQPLPPAVSTEELPPLNAPVVRGDALPPPVGVGPAYQPAPGGRYQQGGADAAPLPPTGSPGYQQPQDGPPVPGAYDSAIPPGPPGSFKQDAIREEAMRSRLRNSPGPVGAAPIGADVSGSIPRGDPSNMGALPPEVRPEINPAKELAPQFRRTLVDYRTKEPAGTIIIDTPNTHLYVVLGNGKALRYGVGVGREGFTWSGVERVTRMLEWPDWTPPEEMIVRQPYLPRFMAGGETNPLGARALYLGNTIYRIHGTNQPSTIGTFVSSGCIRLTNEDVMDLYRRVKVGTRVVVLPGRPPARDSLAPVRAMPGNAAIQVAPPQPHPPAMAR
jgi:lipoprotein-anchoring transpeptidase ErfK/SrfK